MSLVHATFHNVGELVLNSGQMLATVPSSHPLTQKSQMVLKPTSGQTDYSSREKGKLKGIDIRSLHLQQGVVQ